MKSPELEVMSKLEKHHDLNDRYGTRHLSCNDEKNYIKKAIVKKKTL